jgi:methionine-rich copper-binding protein CopC
MFSISGLSPSAGEKQVALNTDIEFTILDDGTGIDISTLIVEVYGNRAVEGVDFKTGFDGVASEINPDGDNFNVVIDPETDFAKDANVFVKVQVKNMDGTYFNDTYVFRTLKEAPVLVTTNPEHGGTITGPQMITLEFEDPADDIDLSSIQVAINGLSFVVDGAFVSEQTGPNGGIYEDSDTVVIKIDPIEFFKNGLYNMTWTIADENGGKSSGKVTFTVNVREATMPDNFPQTGFVGFFQGIQKVASCGDGQSMALDWNVPANRAFKSDVYVLIYINQSRLDIFDSDPSYIARADILSATINGLTPGQTLSFAARAMETYKNALDLTGAEELSDGFWRFPQATAVAQSVLDTDSIIYVDSVEGFGEKGYIQIGTEVIRYNGLSIENNAFLIPEGGRGLLGSTAGVYIQGDEVKFFTNCRDENTVIIMATPNFHDGYDLQREVANTGLVVTDYSDNDQKFFQGYDFCGYHQALPQHTLNGVDDCGTYLGGEYNGFRGFNLFDRMIGREEVLLDQVGEPVILLKRIWDGQICSCMSSRRVHPKVKSCKECFGTGYVGGYSQYDNRRRGDQRVMLSFADAVEDLKLGSYEHLEQDFEPSAWTIPIPAIRDRDLIIRFDFTDDQEYIYEVLKVSREKVVFRHFTRQRLDLKRLDKTDIVYTFKWTL